MDLEKRVKLARLIVALEEDDRDKVVTAYTDMGVRTKRMGERAALVANVLVAFLCRGCTDRCFASYEAGNVPTPPTQH